MLSAHLEFVRNKLLYNPEISPVKNIEIFFEGVKTLKYEWVEIEIKGKITAYIDSAWGKELDLRETTSNFLTAFVNHLINLSMEEQTDYLNLLNDCKIVVRKINHYFLASFSDILIVTRPQKIEDPPEIIKYESLPDTDKISISRCYDLIRSLFTSLAAIIEDETKEFQHKEYIRSKSSYTWSGDKNELSEIALALYLSGWVKRRDGTILKPSVLARELAAYFGIEKLNFDQDINALTFRLHGSKTEGLDLLQSKMQEYFSQRIENQD